MKNKALVAVVVGSNICTSFAFARASSPLPRSTPEAQGVSTQAVLDFVAAADALDTLHSFMVVRHGHVIAEGWWAPEAADKRHVMWSVTKSFNSTAVGLAICEGKLSLDDPVLKFFPEDAPANPSENLKAMKVRDLLTMSCGQATDPNGPFGVQDAKAFLAHPVPFKPGTHFVYNTSGAYMLSAIVTKVTGQTSLQYLKPRLFAPLGIDNPVWDASKNGNSIGGYGLHLYTEDVAKFGQLYLQNGKWNGRQLIPEQWIKLATGRQVATTNQPSARQAGDWSQGYGFQFWRCTHNSFRADGAHGQFSVVLPDEDAVVAFTADVRDTQAELKTIWSQLLPGFHGDALPADPAGQIKLKKVIRELKAHPEPKTK